MNYKIICSDIRNNKSEFDAVHQNPDLYGSSTVASIAGVGFDSPLQVWLRKTGKVPPVRSNPQMRLGMYLEPFVRNAFNEKAGRDFQEVNQIWAHAERPWQIASPDSMELAHPTGLSELAEIKTGRIYAARYWEGGRVADSALCQLQWQLSVSGLSGGFCVGMFGGDAEDLRYQHFEADPEIEEQLLEQVEAFRKLVKEDVPPDAGDGDAEAIRNHLAKKYDKEEEIELDGDKFESLLAEYLDIEKELAAVGPKKNKLEKQKRALNNQIVQHTEGKAGKVRIGAETFIVNHVVKEPYTTKGSEYYTVKLKKQKGEAK